MVAGKILENGKKEVVLATTGNKGLRAVLYMNVDGSGMTELQKYNDIADDWTPMRNTQEQRTAEEIAEKFVKDETKLEGSTNG